MTSNLTASTKRLLKMNIDIKLHKNDLPDDLDLGNVIAVDGEFMMENLWV